MTEEELNNIIDIIADEYESRRQTIINYYLLLKQYPMFKEEDLEECLELLCQKRSTAESSWQIYVAKCIQRREKIDPKTSGIDTIQQSAEKVLREVYPDYFEEMARHRALSIVEDLGEYDVMERDEVAEEAFWKYALDIEDMREKDREKNKKEKEKTKKRK